MTDETVGNTKASDDTTEEVDQGDSVEEVTEAAEEGPSGGVVGLSNPAIGNDSGEDGDPRFSGNAGGGRGVIIGGSNERQRRRQANRT